MEVGHQHVCTTERIPRIDEQRRLSPHRPERPAGRGALQRPQGRGADGHHPPAARPRPRHRLARRRRNLQPLAMQDVRFDLLAAERGEGPRPDVQGDPHDLDAAVLDRREQRLVEVQAGSGRGDRSRPARVHRLVAIRVPAVRLAADVRRQRHRSGPFQEPRDPSPRRRTPARTARRAGTAPRISGRGPPTGGRRIRASCPHAARRAPGRARGCARPGSRPGRRWVWPRSTGPGSPACR